MSLSGVDRDWIKLTVKEIARDLIVEIFPEILNVHMKTCPAAQWLTKSKIFFFGVIAGLGFLGGSGGYSIIKTIIERWHGI